MVNHDTGIGDRPRNRPIALSRVRYDPLRQPLLRILHIRGGRLGIVVRGTDGVDQDRYLGGSEMPPDVYQVAYFYGGRDRVVETAIAGLVLREQIRVFPSGRLTVVRGATPFGPVEVAVCGELRALSPTVSRMVSRLRSHRSVKAVVDHSAAHHVDVKQLGEPDPTGSTADIGVQVAGVAVRGFAALADPTLRNTLVWSAQPHSAGRPRNDLRDLDVAGQKVVDTHNWS